MKVLVTGERGQLGNELRRCFDTMRAEIGPVPGVYKDAKVDYVDYQVLDISDADAVDAWYAEHSPYDLTINCREHGPSRPKGRRQDRAYLH